MKTVTLANGVEMPILGYGVYQVGKDECERCVTDALAVGYRSLDTAQAYFNEEEVGAAIEKSGVARGHLPDHQGVGGALRLRGGKSVCTGIHAQTAHGLP